MANSEKSKHKVLLMYDYFLREMNGYDTEKGVTTKGILEYLKSKTGYEFERKSVYSDVNKLNEFVALAGLVPPDTEWIYREGNTWYRTELRNELSLDEARLIVDAISTTPFTDSGLCEKIEKMYPSYFSGGYKSLVPHDHTVNKKTQLLLNTIRTCIENREVLLFKYGYPIAGAIRATSDKVTSPVALDWENSCYYLIAVDNDEFKNSRDVERSLRRYRVDRMRNHSIGKIRDYLDLGDEKEMILRRYLRNSVDAFSASDSRTITITLRCEDEKTLLRAYNAFSDDVRTKSFISDRTDRGEMTFVIEAGIVPTLFPKLFMLYTFEGVQVEIDDEEVKEKFRGFLKKALKAL